MHFIEVHVVRKQRDDEGYRTDETVPQAEPESGDVTVGSGTVSNWIWSSRTTSQHDKDPSNMSANKGNCFFMKSPLV